MHFRPGGWVYSFLQRQLGRGCLDSPRPGLGEALGEKSSLGSCYGIQRSQEETESS